MHPGGRRRGIYSAEKGRAVDGGQRDVDQHVGNQIRADNPGRAEQRIGQIAIGSLFGMSHQIDHRRSLGALGVECNRLHQWASKQSS